MASHTVNRIANKTLTGTTADDVTVTGGFPSVEVVNRGSGVLWVTSGLGEAVEPTAEGDNVQPVLPNERVTVLWGRTRGSDIMVRLIGDGNPYSVIGVA